MQKDSAQAKISLKVVGGGYFLTHLVEVHWTVDNDWVDLRYSR